MERIKENNKAYWKLDNWFDKGVYLFGWIMILSYVLIIVSGLLV